MRICADENMDAEAHREYCTRGGYNRRWQVLLNGIEQAEVVLADDVAGELIKPELDERGQVQIRDDEIVYETLHGKVEIIRGELISNAEKD